MTPQAAAVKRARWRDRDHLVGRLAGIAAPVLVVNGDEDEACLEAGLLLKRTIPRARLAVVPNSGWPWVPARAGGGVLAFAGYVLAWPTIARAGGGPALSPGSGWPPSWSVSGFISRGGNAVDRYAFLATGAGEREADVRIVGLNGLERVPLAAGCCAAAIFLLATGRTDPPPLDFIWPRAIAPPVGAAAAVALTARYRGRYRASRRATSLRSTPAHTALGPGAPGHAPGAKRTRPILT